MPDTFIFPPTVSSTWASASPASARSGSSASGARLVVGFLQQPKIALNMAGSRHPDMPTNIFCKRQEKANHQQRSLEQLLSACFAEIARSLACGLTRHMKNGFSKACVDPSMPFAFIPYIL